MKKIIFSGKAETIELNKVDPFNTPIFLKKDGRMVGMIFKGKNDETPSKFPVRYDDNIFWASLWDKNIDCFTGNLRSFRKVIEDVTSRGFELWIE